MAMECLGPSLADVRRAFPKAHLDPHTSVRFTMSCLDAIEGIHGCGIVHRDIKPSNFVLPAGPPAPTVGTVGTAAPVSHAAEVAAQQMAYRVYAVDFGLARRYRSSDGSVKEPRASAGFRGTSRYASVASHRSQELGRVDDLWSLFFMLVEWMTGRLPWRGFREKEDIRAEKERMIGPSLVLFLPREVAAFQEHLLTLRYADAPNYAYLRSLLTSCLSRKGYYPPVPLPFWPPWRIPISEAMLLGGGGGAPGPVAAPPPVAAAAAAASPTHHLEPPRLQLPPQQSQAAAAVAAMRRNPPQPAAVSGSQSMIFPLDANPSVSLAHDLLAVGSAHALAPSSAAAGPNGGGSMSRSLGGDLLAAALAAQSFEGAPSLSGPAEQVRNPLAQLQVGHVMPPHPHARGNGAAAPSLDGSPNGGVREVHPHSHHVSQQGTFCMWDATGRRSGVGADGYSVAADADRAAADALVVAALHDAFSDEEGGPVEGEEDDPDGSTSVREDEAHPGVFAHPHINYYGAKEAAGMRQQQHPQQVRSPTAATVGASSSVPFVGKAAADLNYSGNLNGVGGAGRGGSHYNSFLVGSFPGGALGNAGDGSLSPLGANTGPQRATPVGGHATTTATVLVAPIEPSPSSLQFTPALLQTATNSVGANPALLPFDAQQRQQWGTYQRPPLDDAPTPQYFGGPAAAAAAAASAAAAAAAAATYDGTTEVHPATQHAKGGVVVEAGGGGGDVEGAKAARRNARRQKLEHVPLFDSDDDAQVPPLGSPDPHDTSALPGVVPAPAPPATARNATRVHTAFAPVASTVLCGGSASERSDRERERDASRVAASGAAALAFSMIGESGDAFGNQPGLQLRRAVTREGSLITDVNINRWSPRDTPLPGGPHGAAPAVAEAMLIIEPVEDLEAVVEDPRARSAGQHSRSVSTSHRGGEGGGAARQGSGRRASGQTARSGGPHSSGRGMPRTAAVDGPEATNCVGAAGEQCSSCAIC
jgi:serine/threonine protein kinase